MTPTTSWPTVSNAPKNSSRRAEPPHRRRRRTFRPRPFPRRPPTIATPSPTTPQRRRAATPQSATSTAQAARVDAASPIAAKEPSDPFHSRNDRNVSIERGNDGRRRRANGAVFDRLDVFPSRGFLILARLIALIRFRVFGFRLPANVVVHARSRARLGIVLSVRVAVLLGEWIFLGCLAKFQQQRLRIRRRPERRRQGLRRGRNLRSPAERQLLGDLGKGLWNWGLLQGAGRTQPRKGPLGATSCGWARRFRRPRSPNWSSPIPTSVRKRSRREAARSRASLASMHASYAGGRTYQVQEGDTLFDIARNELGKASRWGEIYELNREALGKDFDYLTPGMRLTLPAKDAAPDGR